MRKHLAIEQLDSELARLGRGTGLPRLRLGEALEALVCMGGHRELGFSSVGAYALERCEREPRWAAESRALARRLAGLPRLRHALATGELGWSMAELLARHARPDDELALLEEARTSTVRAMRVRLRDEDPSEPRHSLRVTVPRADGWALEFTRLLLRECGATTTDAFVEALLAEGLTALQSAAPECAHADMPTASRDDAWRARLAAWRSEAEAHCERRVARGVSGSPPREEAPLPSGVHELDAEVRRLAAELAERDLEMGSLFMQLREANGWRRLGWATEEQYARERVGVSYASLKSRLTLARRSARLGAVGEALSQGRIGYEAAQLVARVSSRESVAAWVARASQRTVKHLREEVEAVEMLARASGDGSLLVPPSDETMQAYGAIERYVLTGVRDEAPTVPEGVAADSQISVGPIRRGAGSVSFRFDLREDLVVFWRELEARFRRSNLPGSFVEFLCVATWRSWAHPYDTKEAYAHIYRRDGFRCMSPVCSRRDVTPHHLKFRSHGGTDDEENIASLCTWCHLEGIHGGRIQAEPPASNIRWSIGRTPILVVHGRKRSLST